MRGRELGPSSPSGSSWSLHFCALPSFCGAHAHCILLSQFSLDRTVLLSLSVPTSRSSDRRENGPLPYTTRGSSTQKTHNTFSKQINTSINQQCNEKFSIKYNLIRKSWTAKYNRLSHEWEYMAMALSAGHNRKHYPGSNHKKISLKQSPFHVSPSSSLDENRRRAGIFFNLFFSLH